MNSINIEENVIKEHLLTILKEFERMHNRVRPILRLSASEAPPTKDDLISWHRMIRHIKTSGWIKEDELFTKFQFSKDEKNFIKAMLKLVDRYRIKSYLILVHSGIRFQDIDGE